MANNRLYILLAGFVLITTLVGATVNRSKATTSMGQQNQWHNRMLVIFSPSATHLKWQTQEKLFHQASIGVAQRDLVVFGVLGTKEVSAVTKLPHPVPPPDELRSQYHINPEDFTVILIGKDGSEKYRTHDIAYPSKIFDIIDKMPMRQQEMRQEKHH